MNRLPASWVKVALREIADTSSGGTPSRTMPGYYGGAIPWVKSGELNDGLVRASDESLTSAGLQNSSAKVFPAGTVCIALYGATVGRVGILGIDAATNQAVCGIKPKQGIDQKYLFYFLHSERPNFIRQSQGGAQPNISQEIVRSTDVPICPTREQVRVVEEIEKQFSRLEAATAALNRTQSNLKRYRASLLKAACQGTLVPTEAELARNEGRAYEPADKLLERILRERRANWETDTLVKMIASGKRPKDDRWKSKYDEPLPPATRSAEWLPEGWIFTNLSELKAHSVYGPRFSSDDYSSEKGVVVLRTTDISGSGKVDVSSAPKLQLSDQEIEKYRLNPGDLVFTRTGTVGKLAIFNDEIEAIPGAYLIHYRLCLSSILPWYVYRFFQTERGQRGLLSGTRGIGQPNLNAPTIESIPIPLPPLVEQERILTALDKLLTVHDKQEELVTMGAAKSYRLKQAILQQAFWGKLVPQDPEDEPACLLLERIRVREISEQPKRATRRANRELAHA